MKNMHWRCGGMRAMCLGSTLGINSVLQHPRGRAAQRPTMSPPLLRGMRTIATRPEWKTTDHRTQGPPSSPPLRAWHGVVDEHLHPSVGLMSRSRSLRAVPPTLAEMTPAERSVMDEIKQCGTVYSALLSSASRLYAAKSRELNDDINSFTTSVAEGGTSDLQLTVEMMGPSLSLSRYCVAFFTFADRNLIVGVAALGDDPLIPKGIKMLETIQLQNDDIKSTTYRIYSATAGLDTMSKHKGAQSASPYNELVQFVVSRLQLFVDRDPERYSPHELLKTAHFKGWRVAVQGEGSVEPIRIAGTEDDLRWLEERHVDATGGTTIDSKGFDRREPLAAYYKQQKIKKEKNDPEVGMILFDLATSATWDNDPNVVILIGGESGSGKTWRMITNHSGESHLVVYIRLNSEENANSHNTDYKTIIAQDEILHPKGPRTIDEDVIKAARRARRKAFKAFVLPKVKAAINEVCPALWKKLCGEEKKAFPLFEVRLCFDEMGGNPALIRACCAVGNINLRRGFKWMPWVRIRMFAAGTGVGTVESPGGSENSFYLLATLQRDVYDSADSSSEPSVYWTLRREKLRENVYVKEIADKVDAIADKWGDEPLRRELMAERDKLLKRAMRSVPQRALNPGKRADSLRVVYMREALFSAVEGDRIGRFVLTNARLATLVFARCQRLAEDIVKNSLCLWPSGVDIRREVLQPVAKRFKELNGLKTATPEVACQMLVESLRYVIFDEYVSSDCDAYGAEVLTARRGVLVDNATFRESVGLEHETVKDADGNPVTIMKVIEKIPADSAAEGTQQSNDKAEAEDEEVEEEPVDPPAPTKSTRYTACYRKDIGRFSISPAMVVVLLTLMSIAFGENFASKGDVFEHAVARFLYFAVQVFKDRPVAELVDFIVGHFAVVGKDAQLILNAEHVLCPSNKAATVVRNVVAFSSLTLRMSASLNQDNLINGMMERSKPPRTEESTLSAEDNLTKIKREEACEQFEKLWKAGTGAWIETITGSAASADVVLHIPGVLTLPIHCKDISENYKAQQIKAAMHRVLENQHATEITVPALFSRKLVGLGAPVIPVLYLSRLTTLTHFTSKYPEKKMSVAKFDAIGPGCIMAEGIGEGKISKFVGSSATIDEFCKVQRLHRIRQNLMLFELRPEESKAVVVVATAPEQPEPKKSVPPTGKYHGSFCYKFTKDLYDYIMSRRV